MKSLLRYGLSSGEDCKVLDTVVEDKETVGYNGFFYTGIPGSTIRNKFLGISTLSSRRQLNDERCVFKMIAGMSTVEVTKFYKP